MFIQYADNLSNHTAENNPSTELCHEIWNLNRHFCVKSYFCPCHCWAINCGSCLVRIYYSAWNLEQLKKKAPVCREIQLLLGTGVLGRSLQLQVCGSWGDPGSLIDHDGHFVTLRYHRYCRIWHGRQVNNCSEILFSTQKVNILPRPFLTPWQSLKKCDAC